MKSIPIVTLTSIFLLTSCFSEGKSNMNYSTQESRPHNAQLLSEHKDDDGKIYQIYANPNPKEAYELTATLIDAPDNLIGTKAYAFYESDCAISVSKIAGAYTRLKQILPIQLKKIKDNLYSAIIYGDAILKEDYQNVGKICNWNLSLAMMEFVPSPNLSKIIYTATVDPEDKRDFISNNYWRNDGYITKYRFNEPSTWQEFLKTSASNKETYGSIQRQNLVTIRLELRRK